MLEEKEKNNGLRLLNITQVYYRQKLLAAKQRVYSI